MICLNGKRRYYLIAVASMLLGIALGTGLLAGSQAVQADDDIVIIIDPGHGGIDGGAVGINGTVEKRINLEISLKLRDVLAAAGYNVIMTRDSDISIHDSSANTIREMKVSDLRNRLKLTQLYPNSMLVSIHQNTLGDSLVTGAQVFYSPNNPQSAVLAQSIQDEFNDHIQLENARTTKAAGSNLYLFYNAQNVSVLCECGFLSNKEEEALLCTDDHQNKIVFAIYSGILTYLDDAAA